MSDKNEDKLLEEFIVQSLRKYSVSPTDEEKSFILNEFQHIKFHNKSFNISTKDIIKNKTFITISVLITITIFLIYLFTLLFPAENDTNSNEETSEQNISNTIDSATKSIPTDSLNSATSTPSNSNIPTPSNTPATQYSTNATVPQSTTSIIEKDNVKKFSSNKQDSIPSFPPKKKKKKKKSIDSENNNETTLPVLEPKTPELNPNTKEEE